MTNKVVCRNSIGSSSNTTSPLIKVLESDKAYAKSNIATLEARVNKIDADTSEVRKWKFEGWNEQLIDFTNIRQQTVDEKMQWLASLQELSFRTAQVYSSGSAGIAEM